MRVWPLIQSQTSWTVKSSGPQETLLRTKLVEVMEFQLSYFRSQNMMLLKCCTQCASKFGKLSKQPKDWKRSVFIPIPKKDNAKECSNYHTIVVISYASQRMSTHSNIPAWQIPWTEEPGRLQSMRSRLSLFTFHFHALEKEMATHSNVLAWRISGTGEPGGLLSMGSHRVGHD